jgi:hypothetical protein
MVRTVLLGVVLLAASTAFAMHVLEVGAARHGERYTMAAEVHVRAPPNTVFRLLADYDRWTRLSPAIRQSRELVAFADGRHRVESVTRACVIFFCSEVHQVQDVREFARRRIIATTLPLRSDLRYGMVRWRIEADGTGSRLFVNVELEPNFWVPPLIGPWMIDRAMRQRVMEISSSIERLSAR